MRLLEAEFLAAASATEEFVDRWRTPGDARSKAWEERFGETKYLPLVEQAWQAALDYAWDNGVLTIASMADENSRHHNMPTASNHTLP